MTTSLGHENVVVIDRVVRLQDCKAKKMTGLSHSSGHKKVVVRRGSTVIY